MTKPRTPKGPTKSKSKARSVLLFQCQLCGMIQPKRYGGCPRCTVGAVR